MLGTLPLRRSSGVIPSLSAMVLNTELRTVRRFVKPWRVRAVVPTSRASSSIVHPRLSFSARSAWAVTIFAYLLFYVRLLGGLTWPLVTIEQQSKSSPDRDARRILIASAAAIGVTYGLQALWVITAALQKSIPLTGLDLQPISTSNISLVSFFGVLISSVAVAHNLCKA